LLVVRIQLVPLFVTISYAFLLHNDLFLSVLNIIHVFDLESVWFQTFI